jgi:predicted phosphate transport protein (TIGR00153 family)
MGFLDGIPFLGRDKENRALDLMRRHMVAATESVRELGAFFDALSRHDAEGARLHLAAIKRKEDEADAIVHEVEQLLYSGAFLPISRSRIVDLVERVDDIADAAKDAANIGVRLLDRKHDPGLVTLLSRMAADGIEAAELLVFAFDALRDHRPEDTRRVIEQIGSREHEADQLKAEVYAKLYENGDAMLLFLVSGVADATSGVSDAAENAADSLRLMVIVGSA